MNILFFSRLFNPHIGGVEKHVLEISKLLIKKSHKVIVVTEQDSVKTKPTEVFEGITIYRMPRFSNGKFKKFVIWKWLLSHYQLMREADIIHCHDVFFWYLPFRFLFPFKKIYTTFHGYESYPLESKDIFIRKISEKLSNGNICIGHFIKKWYGTKPNFVAYGGVNLPNSQMSEIESHGGAVFIGRLDEQTGVLTYAEAVEIIRKKIKNFNFLVIGDGNLKNKIGKEIKVLNSENNASEYFKNYDFAFVSRYLSMMEAMAAKRLVFAVYDNPLKEDYLRFAPFSKFITISNSSSELVSKISYYLDNPKVKEKMIDRAYSWVKKHTWEEMTNTYLKLWKI